MTKKELITEIRKYRCSDLSDALDALGLVDKGTMAETMRPIRPGEASSETECSDPLHERG